MASHTWSYFGMGLLGLIIAAFVQSELPVQGGLCDGDGMYIPLAILMYVGVGSGYIYNQVHWLKQKRWVAYRKISIAGLGFITVLPFVVHAVGMQLRFGEETMRYRKYSTQGAEYVSELRLYADGQYFVRTFDTSCDLEAAGTYDIVDNILQLSATENPHDEYGTRFQLEGDELRCLDCYAELVLRRVE